jgi:hypothetical protein
MSDLPQDLALRLLSLDLVGFTRTESAAAGNDDAPSPVGRIATAKNGMSKVGMSKAGLVKRGFAKAA